MNERWLKIMQWWQQLAPREQRILMIGGVFVSVFVLYQGIWMTWMNHVDSLRKRIVSDQKTLQWMQAADKTIETIGQAPRSTKPASPVALLAAVQKQVKESDVGKYLTQLRQSANDAVELQFQKVNFDALITMLTQLVHDQQLKIVQLSVTAEDTPGVVKAEVLLAS